MSGYTIIDVDTHVTELPDLWTSRVPAEIRHLVPNIKSDADGNLMYFIGDQSMGYGPGAVSTASVGNLRTPPTRYEEMHPGAYDAKARLEYMDGLGIWAMVMYPNLGGFGAQTFSKLMDPELMLTCVRTYNDWQTEWASVDARRLLPITTLPFWDVDAAAEEVRRCAAMGHRGVLFTGDPISLGQPAIGDPHDRGPRPLAATSVAFRSRFRARRPIVQEPLSESLIGVDASISQEWPIAPNVLDQAEIAFDDEDGLFVVRGSRQDPTEWVRHEGASPKTNSAARRALEPFVTNPVGRNDEDSICDRMTALDGLPGVALVFVDGLAFIELPTDRRRKEENLRSGECRRARGLGKPLIPTDQSPQ